MACMAASKMNPRTYLPIGLIAVCGALRRVTMPHIAPPVPRIPGKLHRCGGDESQARIFISAHARVVQGSP